MSAIDESNQDSAVRMVQIIYAICDQLKATQRADLLSQQGYQNYLQAHCDLVSAQGQLAWLLEDLEKETLQHCKYLEKVFGITMRYLHNGVKVANVP